MKNNVLSCIAIDDEQPALRIIKEYCSRIPSVSLVATFTNPFDSAGIINNNQVDLIFLDLVMPQISGLEFLKTLYNPPQVIVTSAYKEHASDAFDLNVVDYLVKPFSFDRFARSVSKALRIRNPISDNAQIADDEIPAASCLMVKVEYATIRVSLSDILYIEGLKDYVKIYTDGKLILTKTTMKNIIEKLPPELFFRVHKSYIVAFDRIEMIENSRILIGNQRIPIGESFRSAFFNIVNRNLI